jgi:hypothetical protein
MISRYDWNMRTTISLDDNLGKAARGRARQEGLSLSALVARALKAFLTDTVSRNESQPFRLMTVDGGGPQPGVDLDRTSGLMVAEDEGGYGVARRGK